MSNQGQISKVTETSLLYRVIDNIKYTLFVSQPGKVLSYNTETQLASIELQFVQSIPAQNKTPTLKTVQLSNVPVFQFCGGKGGMVSPINVGDEGLVVFLDRSKDNWLSGKGASVPNMARTHHQNDGVFIYGLHNTIKSLKGYDNNSTVLRYQETVLKLNAKFSMKNAQKDFWTVLTNTMNNLIDTANYLSQTAEKLSTLANTLATAKTVPAVVGVALTMDPGTITNAQSVKSETDIIKNNVDTTKNNLTTDKQDLGELFDNG